MDNTIQCSYCAEEIKPDAKICKHCWSNLSWNSKKYSYKIKNIAWVLALFLWWLGIHKFYLWKPIQGVIYILFVWTFIPAFIWLIESIIYLTMDQEKFDKIFNNRKLEKKNYKNYLKVEKWLNFNLNLKGIIYVFIILFLLISIKNWLSTSLLEDNKAVNTENSSISCQILNSQIIESAMVPLEDCYLIENKWNIERVKWWFKYWYSKDEQWTWFFICDVSLDENKNVISKQCFINKLDLKPL